MHATNPEVIKNAKLPLHWPRTCDAAGETRERRGVLHVTSSLNAETGWRAETKARCVDVRVAHVERTRWPSITSATRGKGRDREREKERERERGRTRWNVGENVARPTSSTSDTRMNTREERCRDGSHQSKGRKLANAQQTREPRTVHRLQTPPPIRPSWFAVSPRGEARLVHEYSDVCETGGRFRTPRSLADRTIRRIFRTRDGIECLTSSLESLVQVYSKYFQW